MTTRNRLFCLFVGLVFMPIASWGVSENEGGVKTSVSIFEDMENPELISLAKRKLDMTMHCAPIRSETTKNDVYVEMSEARWDRFAMGCALEYGVELMDDLVFPVFSIEKRLNLLGAHLTYFDVLNKQYNAHYQGGDLTTELSWRWDKNLIQTQRLLEKVEIYEFFIPEITVMKAAFLLASRQREHSTREVMDATAQAMILLEEVIADSPEAIGGLPLLMLSQSLLALPEFAGGDPLRAIELLEQGLTIDPNNLSFHRWLVEALLGEREKEAAITVLRKAMHVPVDVLHPQDYVDMAKDLGGIAVRLNVDDVAQHFSLNRQKLLSEKPYLLARKSRASVGHGGAHPITGEIANEI